MPYESARYPISPGLKLRAELQEHTRAITCVAWSPDGSALASGDANGSLLLWGAVPGRKPVPLSRQTSRGYYCLAWSPDGRTLASGANDGSLMLWDTAACQVSRTIYSHSGRINSLAWSPGGRTLAYGTEGGKLLLWEPATDEQRPLVTGTDYPFNSLAWSPDGHTLAWGADDGSIRLWSARKLRPEVVKGHNGFVFCVAWSPDGRTLASGSNDRTIHVRDVASGKLKIIESHTDGVTSLSFSADGRLLASKSKDDTAQIWRSDTWESVAVLEAPASVYWQSGLAFNPRAPALALLGGYDTIIRVWDIDLGALLNMPSVVESVHYTTAKITLVGDSGVGKTSLGWLIAHGEFKEQPSTHGHQFWVVDELGARRADGTECEAVLWDLAGQPDYRLVHALFLDDVDLALVLFDPTNRTEPLKGVEYWLKQLSRKGRGRPALLVGARMDRGTPTLTQAELEEFCRQSGVSCGYVSTSALTGAGLDELMRRVKASIAWDEKPATVTTRTFKRIKEFVLALKGNSARSGVLVNPEELRARLEVSDAGWEFTNDEMMTAVGHLATHGYVSVLRGSAGEETILLAPDLLANLAASLVLEARRNEKGLGALDESRVLRGEQSFPELAGLEERERDVLLDAAVVLFIEHNLCFRETLGTQTLLILPALINQKRPLLEDAETADDVSYRVTGAVEHVYAALVVQLGYTNTFKRTNQWQNQAEYETAHGDVCGFRQAEEREGEIELVLYYAKEKAGARLLFQGLFEQFLRGRDVTVTKYPPVNCPACGYRQPRGEVVKRISEQRGFLFCGECGEKIMLPREGEEVALSRADREKVSREQERTRRRTEFESALVRVKGVVRDEKKPTPSCFVSYAWGDERHERWVSGFARDLENAGVEVILDRKDNPQIGANVARFISRVEESDFVAVVGAPLYRRKYENKVSDAGSVVAAEVDLINLRLMGKEEEKATVLPLLLEGDGRASLPPLMRGKVYGNFADDRLYFATLFDLILTLHRIRFDHPAVTDLRDLLRAGAESSR